MSHLASKKSSCIQGLFRVFVVTFLALYLTAVALHATPTRAHAEPTVNPVNINQILDQTNDIRRALGRKPLILDGKLNLVAQEWSNHMARTGEFKHNPLYANQYPKGWTRAGENIAYGFRLGDVVTGWQGSPGHYQNMVDPAFTHIGIGVAYNASGRPYYTQDFGTFTSDPRERPGDQFIYPFGDVSSNPDSVMHSEFTADVKWIRSKGISTGWDDGTYRPYAPVKRDAMAAFLYRAAGSPAYKAPAKSPFRDISTNHPFFKEIMWLKDSRIASGFSDGSFRPDAPITRDAMAAFLHRSAGSPKPSNQTAFSDVPGDSPFAEDISWMRSTGISTGWSDGHYRPFDSTNRDAMAAFLHRFAQKTKFAVHSS